LDGVLGAFVFCGGLFAYAAYRLQAQIDELTSGELLAVLDPQRDRNWWILPVTNPNPFAAENCYVQLTDYRKVDDYLPQDNFPPIGSFRYPWSSYASNNQAQVTLTLGPYGRGSVGIAVEDTNAGGFQTPRLDYAGGRQQVLDWRLGEGEYDVELDAGSENIKARHVFLRISYSRTLGLNVRAFREVVR
jgi:hypothetical protein